MGEPLCADGTVSCFFTKYDERGSTGSQATYPAANSSWAQEIDLDVQMVSALCQSCRIALVEADSNGYTDLGLAVDAAANVPGVVAISNSYGGSEISAELSVASHYSHPGIAITVSTGDNGYGVEWPAAASTVLAVGGTTLSKTNTGWTESAWSGAGSGCSAYVSKPSWQLNLVTSCAGRMVADVAAVADPNTGVRVYTTGSTGSGWYVMGGTSVASPIVATVAALSGVPSSTKDGSGLYLKAQHLFDVVSGSNGKCTSGKTSTAGAALCTAGAGWDGPTGNGSPRGPIAL
jgi:subtilase family serine protease